MTGRGLRRKYKIFCVGGPNSMPFGPTNLPTGEPGCDWETKTDSNDSLWLKRATCPKCGGNTDAFELR